jgi:hypothetical protein
MATPAELRWIRTRLAGTAFAIAVTNLTCAAQEADKRDRDGADKPRIQNPYFETTKWKVWRDAGDPLPGVRSMVREGKQKKVVETTLSAPDAKSRVYPVLETRRREAAPRFLHYAASAKPSTKHAGIWDDVYASWSGLHGYVRNRWLGGGGNVVDVRDNIIHFVDVGKRETIRAGVNFVHQSTTGMAHTITNGYGKRMTERYEKIYFADALVTAPAHSSFVDRSPDRSSDLFMALFPTIFNSVGSSNSETMAITKMIGAGGYLPPNTKLLLKRNGLYPAAMLYIWKASLPYDVAYDHELRHRVAYKAVGDRTRYPEKYGAAGINRGDANLAFHCYDDIAHMRNMIALASSMDVAMPEALLKVEKIEGGRTVYAMKKSVLVVQEKGQVIRLRVSTAECYDLQNRPLTVRWKLLYGDSNTTLEREGDLSGHAATYSITVPWDDRLPEGRTAIALVANNGRFDSNPAVISIYRKRGDLPPNGAGYKDYVFPSPAGNRRPVILDLQDRAVPRGKIVEIPIVAIDPEGFPVRVYKRGGEPGEIDGNVFRWHCPTDARVGPHELTLIASDGTSGNSYAGKTIRLHVGKPKILAHITTKRLSGPAPLTVKVSAKGSIGRRLAFGWEFRKASAKPSSAKAKPKKPATSRRHRTASHTFKTKGLHEIVLTVKSGKEIDTETVLVRVTDRTRRGAGDALLILGNGARIRGGDAAPTSFNHTEFRAVAGEHTDHEFLLTHRGNSPFLLRRTNAVVVTEKDSAFSVVKRPEPQLGPGGSTTFRLRFAPTQPGTHRATITVTTAKGRAVSFRVAGTCTAPGKNG